MGLWPELQSASTRVCGSCWIGARREFVWSPTCCMPDGKSAYNCNEVVMTSKFFKSRKLNIEWMRYEFNGSIKRFFNRGSSQRPRVSNSGSRKTHRKSKEWVETFSPHRKHPNEKVTRVAVRKILCLKAVISIKSCSVRHHIQFVVSLSGFFYTVDLLSAWTHIKRTCA